MFKNIILKNVFFVCLFVLIFTVEVSSKILSLKKIAFFPLYNISGQNDVPEEIVVEIAQRLKEKYNFDVILPPKLEDFFLQNRVRRFGVVTQAQAKELKKLFGIDAVVISWVDLYDSGEHPKIGIGLRVVASETGTILWGNYVALASEDFVSWFCRGEIKSVDKLIDNALEKLLAEFPKKIKFEKIQPIEKPLFALENFSLFPSLVQGGVSVNVSLRIVTLKKPPKKVFLLLGGKKWALKKKENGYWERIISAPYKEGKYYAKLKLATNNGHFRFLDTGHFLEVDNTPPKIRISYENIIFSPNGDGRKDMMIFFPTLLHPDKIKLWSFLIRDADGRIVRRFEGSGELPLGLAWHGENDQFDKVSEGTYFLEGACQDKAGNIATIKRKKIIVDITPPKLNLSAELKEKEVKFKIKCKEKTNVAKWHLSISDNEDNIYYSTNGEGYPPEEVVLPLPDKDPEILYVLAEALDFAGNKAEYKNSLVIKGKTIEKRKKKKKKLPTGWDYEF